MLQQNDSINLVSISQYSNKQKKRYGQQSFNLKKKNHVGKKNHGHTDYIDSQYSHSQHKVHNTMHRSIRLPILPISILVSTHDTTAMTHFVQQAKFLLQGHTAFFHSGIHLVPQEGRKVQSQAALSLLMAKSLLSLL